MQLNEVDRRTEENSIWVRALSVAMNLDPLHISFVSPIIWYPSDSSPLLLPKFQISTRSWTPTFLWVPEFWGLKRYVLSVARSSHSHKTRAAVPSLSAAHCQHEGLLMSRLKGHYGKILILDVSNQAGNLIFRGWFLPLKMSRQTLAWIFIMERILATR